jgi:hypothetical protein
VGDAVTVYRNQPSSIVEFVHVAQHVPCSGSRVRFTVMLPPEMYPVAVVDVAGWAAAAKRNKSILSQPRADAERLGRGDCGD